MSELYPCWFCERPVDQDYLIAGYDTFEEARLACLDCDRAIHALRDKGWLRATPPEPVGGREALLREALVEALQEAGEAEAAAYLSDVRPVVGAWGDRILAALDRHGIDVTFRPSRQ